jgi:hypothetical protein
MSVYEIVIYSKSEEDKAFVHANCVFDHEAVLSGRCNSSSRVLYLVLFDTSSESKLLWKRIKYKINKVL